MILNISGRTDVVHYYSDWLFKRFEEGFVLSRNTLFPNSVRRYELTPEKSTALPSARRIMLRFSRVSGKSPTVSPLISIIPSPLTDAMWSRMFPI